MGEKKQIQEGAFVSRGVAHVRGEENAPENEAPVEVLDRRSHVDTRCVTGSSCARHDPRCPWVPACGCPALRSPSVRLSAWAPGTRRPSSSAHPALPCPWAPPCGHHVP